jgi:N-acetyltransferase
LTILLQFNNDNMNFDSQKSYTLEDSVVLLRPLLETDIEHLLPFAYDEPEIWKYSMVSAAGRDGMQNYISTALNLKKEGKDYPFIVFDKRSGKYAGSTRFYDIQPSADTVQLGFTWYGKDFQGTGLNKHCKYLMLQFAFGVMGVYRVEFRADSRNQRSIAAMKSIGCTVEGTLRSNGYTADGNRRDSTILSIIRDEWEHSVKMNLFKKLTS